MMWYNILSLNSTTGACRIRHEQEPVLKAFIDLPVLRSAGFIALSREWDESGAFVVPLAIGGRAGMAVLSVKQAIQLARRHRFKLAMNFSDGSGFIMSLRRYNWVAHNQRAMAALCICPDLDGSRHIAGCPARPMGEED